MSPKKIKKKRSRSQRDEAPSNVRVVEMAELQAILTRVEDAIGHDDTQVLRDAIDTLAFITRELEAQTITLARLRRFLFGESEKTSEVLGTSPETDGVPSASVRRRATRAGHGTLSRDRPLLRARDRRGYARRVPPSAAGARRGSRISTSLGMNPTLSFSVNSTDGMQTGARLDLRSECDWFEANRIPLSDRGHSIFALGDLGQ